MDSMKKLQALNSKDIFTKLTSYQRHHINMNRLHLSMFITSKSTQTIDLAKSLTVEFPESDVPYIILSKVALKRKNTFLKEMSDHLLKMPKSLSLRLMVIDYLVSQKDFLTALKHIQEILSSLPDNLRYSLKLLQIAIPIYIETNTQTTQLIKSAVDYWSKYSDYIIEKIADIALDNKCYEIAAEIYQTLVKKNPENQNALSNLVLAFSNFNLKDAKTYIEYLPKVEFDEVEDVEEGIVALSLEPVVSPVARLKNKRRRKKAKVVDPNLKLDPERWLPKRERGLRGKKAKKDLNKGPQGVNMAGGGIGGTGSARIAGYSAPKVEMEEVPVVVISGKAAGKKKKGKK